MKQRLIVSPSPHLHSGDTIEKNMYGVLIALLPAFLVALYIFRLDALIITCCSALFCLGFEYLIVRFIIKKRSTILDGSAIITGVLLAFIVPSTMPIWTLALGCLFAIGVVKLSFGGLGNNIFNPAIAGHIFLLILFPVQMTTWPTPVIVDGVNAISGVNALALLLGLGYMLWRRIITWHIPVSILGTAALFCGILYLFNPIPMYHPLSHLFSGGLMLGAIFMATDYATSPMSKKGMLIYGVSIGFITMVIRLWGTYPEGISFAILLMNAFTPLIDNFAKPKRFGEAMKHG